jgi:hypothetical protein
MQKRKRFARLDEGIEFKSLAFYTADVERFGCLRDGS